ncbi:MAG: glycosyltransferase family 2 protein [Phycisphaerae bacterium]
MAQRAQLEKKGDSGTRFVASHGHADAPRATTPEAKARAARADIPADAIEYAPRTSPVRETPSAPRESTAAPQNSPTLDARLAPRRARRRNARPTISVVIPAFNEQECLPLLHARLTGVLSASRTDYELVFVDDGSRDATLPVLRRLAASDAHVRYGSFSRNFGHEAASSAGLCAARGEVVVLMDADLQDPPELLPEMLEQWRLGYDVVLARRRARAGESRLKRATSWLFYRVLRGLTGSSMPLDTGDFRLLDRAVLRAFRRMSERTRFVRGMMDWIGYPQTTVEFDRPQRAAGRTKYNLGKLLRLAIDALVITSTRPLRWAFGVGLTLCAAALIASLCAASIGGGFSRAAAIVAAAVSGLSLVQVGGMALLAEYVACTHVQSQARPIYLVAEQGGRGLGRAPRRTQRRSEAMASDVAKSAATVASD